MVGHSLAETRGPARGLRNAVLLEPASVSWKAYLGSAAVVLLAAAVAFCLQQLLASTNVALVFLTAVMASAILHGLKPSLFASLLSVFVYNFFFLPPLYVTTLADPENIVAMFFFVIVAVIVSDLAERMRRQTVAARMAAETDRLRSALLASISHDLRTPLASILGSVTSLSARPEALGETARREMLATIQEQAELLNRYIGNLLDMTRLESGAILPHAGSADLCEVVGSALARAAPMLDGRPLDVRIPPDLPLLEADEVLLEQVIFNLLDNAAKYTPSGSAVRLQARRCAKGVELEVADEGDGIPPSDLERVFEKFYRAQAADRRRVGTGLGLAICRGFVEAMGGSIRARNRTDRPGAVFTVVLPAAAPAAVPQDGL